MWVSGFLKLSKVKLPKVSTVIQTGYSRHVYSNNEFYDMMLCVGAALNHSVNQAREPSEGRPSARSVDLEEQILHHLAENPRTSTRRAGALLEVNHMVIWCTLRDDGQHPYHFRKTQELQYQRIFNLV